MRVAEYLFSAREPSSCLVSTGKGWKSMYLASASVLDTMGLEGSIVHVLVS